MIDIKEHDEVAAGSERGFGLVFGAVFALAGLWPLLRGQDPRWWLLAASVVALFLAWLAPQSLRVFNQLWFRFGMLLGNIVAPVVMGLIFFLAVTPTALIMRLRGKDLLDLRFDERAGTYWKERAQGQTASMRDQF